MRRILGLGVLVGVLIMPMIAIGLHHGMEYGFTAFGYYILSVIFYAKMTKKVGVIGSWALLLVVAPFFYTLFFVFSLIVSGLVFLGLGVSILGWVLIRYRQLITIEKGYLDWKHIETKYPSEIEKYELQSIEIHRITPEGETELVRRGIMYIDLSLEYEVNNTIQTGVLSFNHIAALEDQHITAEMIASWQQNTLNIMYDPKEGSTLRYFSSTEAIEKRIRFLSRRRAIIIGVTLGMIVLGGSLIYLESLI